MSSRSCLIRVKKETKAILDTVKERCTKKTKRIISYDGAIRYLLEGKAELTSVEIIGHILDKAINLLEPFVLSNFGEQSDEILGVIDHARAIIMRMILGEYDISIVKKTLFLVPKFHKEIKQRRDDIRNSLDTWGLD